MTNSNEVNRMRLLWAGFMAILAAGVGFAIRGGIFDNWGSEFGFTGAQLGAIGGAGFTGFCFGIIFGGIVVDKIGYGKLVVLAFACHVLSAVVTFAASTPDNAYAFLFWGMFLFAYANGTLEAVANPLVATAFPENRTHYLNILHASWPAGLILGGIIGWTLDDKLHLDWKLQLALYLVPTLLYGIMFMGQKFPQSEASKKGMSIGGMFKDVGILGGLVICYLLSLFFGNLLGNPIIGYCIGGALLIVIGFITNFSMGSLLLFVLFLTHALIGAVELGTDGWIQNITGNLFNSEQGKWLFIWTSSIMFALRFCAEWLEKKLKLSPVSLLFICSVLAFLGLQLAGGMSTLMIAFGALGLYAIGKTFFWPTMLAVASDRFPRTGAIAISIMGGIGMMSAGLIGSEGLGYSKDRFSAKALEEADAAVYAEYKAGEASSFLFLEDVHGIDGTKLGGVQGKLGDARAIVAKGGVAEVIVKIEDGMTADEKKAAEEKNVSLHALAVVLKDAGVLKEGGSNNLDDGLKGLTKDELTVQEASITGDRKTLKADSFIPLTMAVIYLALMLYFRSIGGYKALTIDEQHSLSEGNAKGTAES
ncbi:MAG: MFS transporter [Verrucomicrobia bacterium]|nr:MFS transporter [Verrucomicrobiota bacterium]